MPTINRFYRRTPYEGDLSTPPLDLIAKAMAVSQDRYDKNFLATEALRNKYIDALPQDRAVADQMQTGYEARIDELIASNKGNMASPQFSRSVYQLQKDIEKDFSPGGKAAAIISNKKNFGDWYEAQRKNKDILDSDLNAAYTYYMEGYQGVGEKNSTTGNYNILQPEEVHGNVDINAITQKAVPLFKPEKKRIKNTFFRNGLKVTEDQEVEYLDPTRIKEGLVNAFQADPKLLSYLQQKAKFSGVPFETMLQGLDQYATQQAEQLSYRNESNLVDRDRDPLALENLRQSNRIALAKMKGEIPSGELPFFTGQPVVNAKGVKLDDKDWRKTEAVLLTESPNKRWQIGSEVSTVGPLGAYAGSDINTSNIGYKPKESLLEFAYSNKGKEAGIDTFLLEKAAMDLYYNNGKGGDMRTWQQHREKFVKDNEQSIVSSYNKLTDEFSLRDSNFMQLPPASWNNLTKLMTSNVLGLKVPFTLISEDGRTSKQTSLNGGLITKDDLIDESGKPKGMVTAYAGLSGTNSVPGYVLSIPGKGTIVVHDNDLRRAPYFAEASKSLDQVISKGEVLGDPFRIGVYNRELKMDMRIAPMRVAERDGIHFQIVGPDGNTIRKLKKSDLYAPNELLGVDPDDAATIMDLNNTVHKPVYNNVTLMGGDTRGNRGNTPVTE